MAPHTWSDLGDTVSDATHHMYYRGQRIKEAYYRGEKIWGEDSIWNEPTHSIFIIGTRDLRNDRIYKTHQWNLYVSRVELILDPNIPMRLVYKEDSKDDRFVVIPPTEEAGNAFFYDAASFEPPMTWADHLYRVYLEIPLKYYTPNLRTWNEARFMSYLDNEYVYNGAHWKYPGSPELNNTWFIRKM